MLCLCVCRLGKVQHQEQEDWNLLMQQMKEFTDKFDMQQVRENSATCKSDYVDHRTKSCFYTYISKAIKLVIITIQ